MTAGDGASAAYRSFPSRRSCVLAGTVLFCPCRKEGAERSGVATAGSDVSFIEQIGGAGTEPSRVFAAGRRFDPGGGSLQAQPSGSMLSRAPICGATSADYFPRLSPQLC